VSSDVEKDVLYQMNAAHDDMIDKYADLSTRGIARVRAQIQKFGMRIVQVAEETWNAELWDGRDDKIQLQCLVIGRSLRRTVLY
jgi:hypothetical protein